MSGDLEARVARLEAQVDELRSGRPGRKAMPILISKDGVCGVEPASDSSSCPYASLYRRQKGCKGTACRVEAATYYAAKRKVARESGSQ